MYREHDFTTVPYLTVSPLDFKRDTAMKSFYPSEDKWLISNTEVFGVPKLISFVNNHLKTDVSLKVPFSEILFKNLIGFVIIGCLF